MALVTVKPELVSASKDSMDWIVPCPSVPELLLVTVKRMANALTVIASAVSVGLVLLVKPASVPERL